MVREGFTEAEADETVMVGEAFNMGQWLQLKFQGQV